MSARWNPKKSRDGEQIGGGWFVFRRGDGTNRIRPSKFFPFEHPSEEAARTEADRLAELMPGYTFEVFGSTYAASIEKREAAE